ncbi:PREDICTED: putative F-box protein At1g47765 [Camelina sativa]|uniref:F-box protein At1g47765 n=1 Tax=Camelina sativa TaxID=90675 RepID=A0ABM0VYU3_CAMSA|nr:PREDICTED: putative F-box protein At1g47765 [Camelina sativa]
MEQQKEKKRKVSKRQRSTQSQSFPRDLTSEILLTLPEKSVARFRCVSKLWLSITTDPYFINVFKNRYRGLSLLICFIEDDKLFVSSIPQHQHSLQNSKRSYSCSQPIYRYHMEFPEGQSNFPPTKSVQGLICFNVSATPIVWNPSTRQLLTLTKPRLSWNDIAIFLGYDPVEGIHKVMCIPLKRSSDVCRVLTLGSAQEQEPWRTVKTCHKHRSEYHTTSGRCIKGVVYYIAYVYHKRVWVIMSFDVRYEKFDMMQLPSENISRVMMTYEGRLACVENCVTKYGKLIRKHGTRLYILEDAKKHKWLSKVVLAPGACFDDRLKIYYQLNGYTHDGEFVYVSSTFDKKGYILFCDPLRNSFRRFELKGIAEGVLKSRMYALYAFPNHVESQITLK